jgi:sugar phosphate isomerase/epimerase
MQISMWSSYLYELSPEDMVRTFVQYGWNCTELSTEHGWMLLDRGNPVKVGEELRKFAEDQGFSFPQGHFYLNADIAHPDDQKRSEIMEDLKRWSDLFAALGITAGVLHPGGGGLRALGYKPEKIFACNLKALEQISDFTKGSPTTICLENGGSIDSMLDLVNAVTGNELGLCLDTGHLNMAGGDCADFVRRAGKKLKALHLTDSIGNHDDHILPHSAGTINWEEFIIALGEVDYDGLFNFEVPRENRCPMKIRLAKLDYVRKLAMLMLNA